MIVDALATQARSSAVLKLFPIFYVCKGLARNYALLKVRGTPENTLAKGILPSNGACCCCVVVVVFVVLLLCCFVHLSAKGKDKMIWSFLAYELFPSFYNGLSSSTGFDLPILKCQHRPTYDFRSRLPIRPSRPVLCSLSLGRIRRHLEG